MDINWLNPNYALWLIPVPPLLAFALIILFSGGNKRFAHITALAGVAISLVLSWGLFFEAAFDTKGFGLVTYGDSIDWMDLGTGKPFQMGVLADPLTAVMLFMVPFAMMMIFIYSIGYMGAYPLDDAHQKRNTRFFAYLSLFAGAMLTLVVADNLLLLFMGWEVMGLCSYLLIGFLYEKKSAYQAAVKAFMTTRVADVLFLVGIGYLYATTGTLSFRDIMYNESVLHRLASMDAPLLGLQASALIGICIVIGTIGKAAQFPLHIWLPDAMEGPTPVSAMIHAAAMVSAGVYLVIRMYPVISAGADPHHGHYNEPLILMGVIGAGTALFAAVLGVGQNDIKRVLAYSTISQLGFMVAALGIGAYVAAAFHLITHAFFKALLFMASGAVIHAMEHGEHHAHEHAHGHDEHGHDDHAHDAHGHHAVPAGAYGLMHANEGEALPEWNPKMVPDGIQADYAAYPNDMRNMGGLWDRIPLTALTLGIGGLSLAGFPLITAGFWSKDEIFADALMVGVIDGHFYWLHFVVFLCLFLAACLTAFYTSRLWILTFWHSPRSEAAKYATLMKGHYVDEEKLAAVAPNRWSRWYYILTDDSVVSDELKGKSSVVRFLKVFEDSFPMQLPLVLLSFFAITAGWVGIHKDFTVLKLITGEKNFFHDFLHYVILEVPAAPKFSWIPVLSSIAAVAIGMGGAYLVYWRKATEAGEKDPVHAWLGDEGWAALQNRFYLDGLVLRYLYVPFEWFGRRIAYEEIDNKTINELLYSIADGAVKVGEAIKRFNYVVIDGVGDGIPALIGAFSRWFRSVQSGRAQQYMLYAAVALLAMGTLLVLQTIF